MGINRALSRYRRVKVNLVDWEYGIVDMSSLQKKILLSFSNKMEGRDSKGVSGY